MGYELACVDCEFRATIEDEDDALEAVQAHRDEHSGQHFVEIELIE